MSKPKQPVSTVRKGRTTFVVLDKKHLPVRGEGAQDPLELIEQFQHQLNRNKKDVAKAICENVGGKGTSISGFLLSAKKSEKNTNVTVTMYIGGNPGVSRVMVNSSEGRLMGSGFTSELHLNIMFKIPLEASEIKPGSNRKYRYESSGDFIVVRPNSELTVSIYFANANEPGYKELLEATPMVPITLVGVLPTYYIRKNKEPEPSAQALLAAAPVASALALVQKDAPDQQQLQVQQQQQIVVPKQPTQSVAYNADSAIIHKTKENAYLRIKRLCPAFPFYPVVSFETLVPTAQEVDEYLELHPDEDASNRKRVENRLWKENMTDEERRFYMATLQIEIGHVRPEENLRNVIRDVNGKALRGITRSITTLKSLSCVNQKKVKEPELVGLTTYFQFCPKLDNLEAFYVSFHVRPDLVGQILKITDVKMWEAIAEHHVPQLRITGWCDYGDSLTRKPYVDGSDYAFGLKLVTKAILSGLIEYLMSKAFEVTWEYARTMIHKYYGIDSDDMTEIKTEPPEEVHESQVALGKYHPDITNMIETDINKQNGGSGGFGQRAMQQNYLYCLPAIPISDEQTAIYNSWPKAERAEIISAVLSGNCSTPELKKYAAEIDLKVPKDMMQAFYLVRKAAHDEYKQILKETLATRPLVPYLYEESELLSTADSKANPSSVKNEGVPPIIVTPTPLLPPQSSEQNQNTPVEESSTPSQNTPVVSGDNNESSDPTIVTNHSNTTPVVDLQAEAEAEDGGDANQMSDAESDSPVVTTPVVVPSTKKKSKEPIVAPSTSTTKKVAQAQKPPAKLGKREGTSVGAKTPASKKTAPSSQQ